MKRFMTAPSAETAEYSALNRTSLSTPPLRFRAQGGRGGRKNVKSRGWQEALSSGHVMAELMEAMLPASHQTDQHSRVDGRGAHEAPFLSEELPEIDGC